eukprot:748672-Hanusia_phi.AAC.1
MTQQVPSSSALLCSALLFLPSPPLSLSSPSPLLSLSLSSPLLVFPVLPTCFPSGARPPQVGEIRGSHRVVQGREELAAGEGSAGWRGGREVEERRSGR